MKSECPFIQISMIGTNFASVIIVIGKNVSDNVNSTRYCGNFKKIEMMTCMRANVTEIKKAFHFCFSLSGLVQMQEWISAG